MARGPHCGLRCGLQERGALTGAPERWAAGCGPRSSVRAALTRARPPAAAATATSGAGAGAPRGGVCCHLAGRAGRAGRAGGGTGGDAGGERAWRSVGDAERAVGRADVGRAVQ